MLDFIFWTLAGGLGLLFLVLILGIGLWSLVDRRKPQKPVSDFEYIREYMAIEIANLPTETLEKKVNDLKYGPSKNVPEEITTEEIELARREVYGEKETY